MGVMIVLLLTAQAHASCPRATTEAELVEHLNRAMDAYAKATSAGLSELEQHMAEADAALACLGAPLSTRGAVLLHQAAGLRMRTTGQAGIDDARQAFASARSIDASARLRADIAPGPEVEVFNEYIDIPLDTEVTEPLPRPRRGTLYINGAPSRDLAQNWPEVVQYADRSGEVRFTEYHLPGDDTLPYYPNSRSARGPLTVAVPSAALLGAGAYLLGSFYYSYSYYSCSPSDDEEYGCDQAYYTDQLQWRQVAGFALAGTGSAGLVASGLWMRADGDRIQIGARGSF